MIDGRGPGSFVIAIDGQLIFGTGIVKSISIWCAHVGFCLLLLLPHGGFGSDFFVTLILFGFLHSSSVIDMLTLPALIIGHGGRGIGTLILKSRSNKQPGFDFASSQFEYLDRFGRMRIEFFGRGQPTGNVLTVTEPLILGQGGVGTGMARSRSMKKLQPASSLPPQRGVRVITMCCRFGMQPSGAVDTIIDPSIDGHSGTTRKVFGGGGQSKIGGGGG